MKKIILFVFIALICFCAYAVADTLNLPDGLVEIENQAFMGDTSLSGQLVIPYGVQKIGAYAFAGCSGFTGLPEIPESVKVIEEHAFDGCSGISGSLYLSSDCVVADSAFSNTSEALQVTVGYMMSGTDFSYTRSEDGITITGYNGTETRIFIPQTIDGDEVRFIGENAFKGKSTLSYVSLPTTVEKIGKGSFQNTGISAIRIPPNVKQIEESAFYNCRNLSKLELCEGLESIGKTAFRDCTSLKQVNFPDSVKYVGYRAFQKCSSLTFTNYPVGLESAGGQVFYNCEKLISVTISEGVTNLKGNIFNSSDIKNITLPSTLCEIEENAFSSCYGITNVQLPDALKVVGKKAFYSCSNLLEIEFPKQLERLGESAFAKCTSLNKIRFSDQIETLDSGVFSGCTGLFSIIFPQNMTAVGSYMFSECSNISEIIFPSELNVIGERAFRNCSGIVSLTLPESIQTINSYAFENCTALETINIPESLETAGKGIFKGCTSLTEYVYPDGRKIIPDNLFSMSELVTITIPESVLTIGESVFSQCNSLTDVHLPAAGLQYIDNNAFYGCKKLSAIELPETVQAVGNKVFSGCTMLSEIIFSPVLEGLGDSAFQSCSSLVNVDLPDSVEVIGQYAFYDCPNLESFHYPVNLGKSGTTLVQFGTFTFGKGIFNNSTKLVSIDIPEGVTTVIGGIFLKHAYLETVHLPSTIKNIDVSAFQGCTALKNINFPDGLTLIGKTAFRGCSSLETVNLPDSVIEIRPGAFNDCESLSVFRYPAGLKYADTFVILGNLNYIYDDPIFSNTNAFEEVTIPDGVISIPRGIFRNAGALNNIHIPDSVTRIESYAFANLSNLSHIYLSEYLNDIHSTSFKQDPNLVIECEWGTYALNYAKSNSIPYKYLSRTGYSSLNSARWPSGNLYKGNNFTFGGYVRASSSINMIKGTIKKNGSIVKQYTINPYESDYGLGRDFGSGLGFVDLDLGNYTFTLEAASDELSKTLVDTSFTIVPQPTMLNVAGANVPKGIISPNFKISGNIVGNYSISKIDIIVWNEAKTQKKIELSVNPGVTNYDLSSITNQCDFSQLQQSETYLFEMDVVTNGTTYDDVVYNIFYPIENTSTRSSEDVTSIVKYTKNYDNIQVFGSSKRMAEKYMAENIDMSTGFFNTDAFIIGLNNMTDIYWGEFEEFFTGRNGYYVDMYKGEILSILRDIAGEEITNFDKNNVVGEISDWVSNGGEFANKLDDLLGKFSSDATKYAKKITDEYEGVLDTLGQVKDTIELANDMIDRVAYSLADNLCQLSIISTISETLEGKTSSNLDYYKQALDELYDEYTGDLMENIRPVINKLTSELSKSAIKETLKLFGKNTSSLYSATEFAIKVINELTGWSSESKTKMKFITKYNNCISAYNMYQDAFMRVRNGDVSDEAIDKFLIIFVYARATFIDMNNFLFDSFDNIDDVNELWPIMNNIKNLKIAGLNI